MSSKPANGRTTQISGILTQFICELCKYSQFFPDSIGYCFRNFYTANLDFTPEYSLSPAAGKGKAVRVQRGDTLRSLARKYQVSVAQLASWNRLSANAPLRAGQTLRLQNAPAAPRKSKASPAPSKRSQVAQNTPKKRGGVPAKRKR